MRKVVIASNMFNEVDQLDRWFGWVKKIADYILIVDTGSTDGTIERATELGATVILDDIIQREGYGPARNHLRNEARKHFPEAHWLAYFDADETISEHEFHRFRFIKDYLIDAYDVIAFPRVDWLDADKKEMAKDYHAFPDWQARMTRLNSPVEYYRRLHEQIRNFFQIFASLSTPKINHFHRQAQDKREFIGKLCAKLHMEDKEYGHQVPEHPKEAHYRKLLEEEGLVP